MSKPKPPTTLGAAGKALWDDVVSLYDLRVDELRILEDACSATDMLVDLETAWRDEGRPLTAKGSMGQMIEHPLIGSIDKQRKARQAFLRSLKLPDPATGAAPANQQRSAAQSRWAAAHGASK